MFDFTCGTDDRCNGFAGFEKGNRVAGFSQYALKFIQYWNIRVVDLNIVVTGDQP
ncbi:hypothetical protein CP97_14731 [Aurantiacibacter atlanticus]|uniref:Uncharacterized protein n=1 Tax=Aurantiacibacter atlanticus TaxID=1648404 RepID=A0A168M1L9_9SPHN|nr:hypothetical protein CP97_14731 [Aurantiacibacter atlanticus]